jgi:hypothetical protein
VGIGPISTPPHFLAPIVLSTNISGLADSSLVFTPQTTVGGPLSYPAPQTLDWTLSIQHDLGKGIVLDVAYVANSAHHQFNQGLIDLNAVAPLTDWTPTANNGSPGAVAKFLDPTSASGGTGGFYSTNLIRALAGPYPGWGGIQMYTSNGESHYESLQVQFNKRAGKNLHFGSNYTWSKTLSYSRNQWVSDKLLENIVSGTRPHAVNVTFGYSIPGATKYWNNKFTELVTNGWHVEGILTFYYGTPLSIGCSANGAPIGYWTGTPTGGIPFRCQQSGPLFNSAQTPTAASPLWYDFNVSAFALPPVNSLGIGNEQPTVTYGPGVENTDISLYKQFRIWGESKTLELRAEAFNALNHFNPSNPNTSLAINCNAVNGACTPGGANTNAAFGQITSAALPARHAVVSVRFRF